MHLERMITAALLAALVVGCDSGIGAREVDYSPQRSYSADIDASLDHGPTATKPGMTGAQEPIGAFPWEINESRE